MFTGSSRDKLANLVLKSKQPYATTPNVQKALDVLRVKEQVWKANRGEYALEDSSMAEWPTRNRLTV